MRDKKEILNEIEKLKTELKTINSKELIEKYGEDFGCSNCRYDCFESVQDYHTMCTKYNCVLCTQNGQCCDYKPENKQSKLLKNLFNLSDEFRGIEIEDILDIKDENFACEIVRILYEWYEGYR